MSECSLKAWKECAFCVACCTVSYLSVRSGLFIFYSYCSICWFYQLIISVIERGLYSFILWFEFVCFFTLEPWDPISFTDVGWSISMVPSTAFTPSLLWTVTIVLLKDVSVPLTCVLSRAVIQEMSSRIWGTRGHVLRGGVVWASHTWYIYINILSFLNFRFLPLDSLKGYQIFTQHR